MKIKKIGKKFALSLIAFLAVLIFSIYGAMFYEVFKVRDQPKSDPLVASRFYQMLVCADGVHSLPGLSSVCEFALARITFTQAEIDQINALGSIGLLSQSDKNLAATVLPRLIEMGADIDAIQVGIQPPEQQWTALHHAVFSSPWWTELLLKYNADVHKKDAAGRTPLDLAKELAAKKPDNADWAAIVNLLEKHEPTH